MESLLITGGTGSFGNSMTRRLLDLDFQGRIVIFSRDEKKQIEMRHRFPDKRVEFFIGDVRSLQSLKHAARGVDVLIHAAALKHVPTGEIHPTEVIATNIHGCMNILEAGEQNGCSKVICLSSDKAVYPINSYGMTKSLAEKIVTSMTRTKTTFCNVRYGNVLGSRGSVIPYWIQCLSENQPLRITDRGMTRFLLPLQEAIDMVLYAVENGKPGELFVRKSHACNLDTLVKAIKKCFNKPDHPETVIGARPGEKIHETLITSEEMARATDLPNGITLIRPYYFFTLTPDYYETELDFHREDFTSQNTKQLDLDAVIDLLKRSNCLEGEVL